MKIMFFFMERDALHISFLFARLWSLLCHVLLFKTRHSPQPWSCDNLLPCVVVTSTHTLLLCEDLPTRRAPGRWEWLPGGGGQLQRGDTQPPPRVPGLPPRAAPPSPTAVPQPWSQVPAWPLPWDPTTSHTARRHAPCARWAARARVLWAVHGGLILRMRTLSHPWHLPHSPSALLQSFRGAPCSGRTPRKPGLPVGRVPGARPAGRLPRRLSCWRRAVLRCTSDR